MKKFLINLDRSPDRLALFQERNRHVMDVERFAAIDGQLLSREDVIKQGIANENFNFSKGSTGSAMSHMILWERASNMNESITVIEDDVILSNYFDRKLRVVSSVGKEWDFIAWGWNFDAPLFADLMPSVTRAKVELSQENLRRNIEKFPSLDLRVTLVPLIHLYGIMCYSMSPRGAKKFLAHCKPIKAGPEYLDDIMGALYRSTNSYVSIPPIAVSENFYEKSLNNDA